MTGSTLISPPLVAAAQAVCRERTGRRVLVEWVRLLPNRDGLLARVSADDGKTWGTHRVGTVELAGRFG